MSVAFIQLLLLLWQIYEQVLAARLPFCQLSYPRAGNMEMRLIQKIRLMLQTADEEEDEDEP